MKRISHAELRAVFIRIDLALQVWTIWEWEGLTIRQNWRVPFADRQIRSASFDKRKAPEDTVTICALAPLVQAI